MPNIDKAQGISSMNAVIPDNALCFAEQFSNLQVRIEVQLSIMENILERTLGIDRPNMIPEIDNGDRKHYSELVKKFDDLNFRLRTIASAMESF